MKTNTKNFKAKIGVLGGDRRQLAMAEELAGKGFEVAVSGFDRYEGDLHLPTRCVGMEGAVSRAAAVILPLPYSQDNIRLHCPFGDTEYRLTKVFDLLTADQAVIGGRFNDTAHELALGVGVTLYDYCDREDFNIANAVPTAEGALAVAMEHLPVTIHNSRCAVLGYGRIGKVLCRTLSALGADVTAAARKVSDLAWIRAAGYHPLPIRDLTSLTEKPDVIFNTVPEVILDRTALEHFGKNTLIVDLASKPGGVDRQTAQELGIPVVWALSLPGKTSPVTAGKIIADSVLGILYGEGVLPPWKP